MAGPLSGISIVEFAGIGPGPFCAMMLADHGAEVIRIERPGGKLDPRDALSRNRTSIVLNTKTVEGLDRKSTRLNSSHRNTSRMPSSA